MNGINPFVVEIDSENEKQGVSKVHKLHLNLTKGHKKNDRSIFHIYLALGSKTSTYLKIGTGNAFSHFNSVVQKTLQVIAPPCCLG